MTKQFNDFRALFDRQTNEDVLDLSEISLDLNLVNNNLRYKFTDAPILAVSIAESQNNILVLVATVSSLHQLKFVSPQNYPKSHDDAQSFSIFHGAGQHSRDPSASFYHVINQVSASSMSGHPFQLDLKFTNSSFFN